MNREFICQKGADAGWEVCVKTVEREIVCRCMKNEPPLEEKRREKDDECWPFLRVTADFGVVP